MINLLNFPHNLEEMMREEEDGCNSTPMINRIRLVLNHFRPCNQEELAVYLGLTIHEWQKWILNHHIPPDLKVALSRLKS